MDSMANDVNKRKAEHLHELLKDSGINSSEELDRALSETLKDLTLGIMTDAIVAPASTA